MNSDSPAPAWCGAGQVSQNPPSETGSETERSKQKTSTSRHQLRQALARPGLTPRAPRRGACLALLQMTQGPLVKHTKHTNPRSAVRVSGILRSQGERLHLRGAPGPLGGCGGLLCRARLHCGNRRSLPNVIESVVRVQISDRSSDSVFTWGSSSPRAAQFVAPGGHPSRPAAPGQAMGPPTSSGTPGSQPQLQSLG